jgi:outer membrane immunogenic protein
MKKTIAAALAVATLSSPALAADLGSGGYKDSTEYPVAGAVVRWTGVYIGVEGGYAFGNANLDFIDSIGTHTHEFTNKGEALTGGVGDITIGYDFHIPASRWVVGVFGDYVFGKADATASFSHDGIELANVGLAIDNQWKLGGRIGLIVTPGTMTYTKVGWSQADLNVSHSAGVGVDAAYSSPTVNGWLLGAGFESHVVAGLFLRGEYNYVNYGKSPIYSYSDVGVSHTVTADIDEHLVKVGLVYKLGFDGNSSFK